MSDNLKIGSRELGAVASEEDNVDEYIGFIKFSTTGEALVPREWLLEQWDRYNELSNSILPTKVTKWQAFRRTIQTLRDDTDLLNYEVYNEEYDRKFDCRLNIEKSRSEGTNVYIVYARTFFPEEIIGEEGGDFSESRVGLLDFQYPEEGDGYMVHKAEIEKDNVHYGALEKLFNKAREVYKTHRDSHNFNDINGILESYRGASVSKAIEIRRACYFVPAPHKESLEALAEIWEKMNQFKESGEEMRIDKTPVVDIQEQRELVADSVRKKMEKAVNNSVSKIVSEFEDAEQQTADEAANKLLEQLEETQDITTSYNVLLNTQLSLKEVLEEKRGDLEEEAQEIVQNAIDQETLGEYDS